MTTATRCKKKVIREPVAPQTPAAHGIAGLLGFRGIIKKCGCVSRPRTSSTMSTVSPSTTFNTVAVVGGRYGGLCPLRRRPCDALGPHWHSPTWLINPPNDQASRNQARPVADITVPKLLQPKRVWPADRRNARGARVARSPAAAALDLRESGPAPLSRAPRSNTTVNQVRRGSESDPQDPAPHAPNGHSTVRPGSQKWVSPDREGACPAWTSREAW